MKTTVLITRHAGVLEVDFSGTILDAAIMIARHYPDATEAWLCRDGKRTTKIWRRSI